MAAVGSAPAIAAGFVWARPDQEAVTEFEGSVNLDAILDASIKADEAPGAVLIVGHQGKIVHRKAYGSRSVEPAREPMTINTVFDAASLTKVIATSSALTKFFEWGRLRIADRVTQYLPEFQGGKTDVTVRDLMTHFSGMRPDLDLVPEWSGYDTAIRMALAEKCVNPPGTHFVYSDINFILLGEIVRRLAGEPLPDFVRKQVFEPLSMSDSMFNPPYSLVSRIAPTENVKGKILRGVVHDPTARNMGGIAGHAGLFTTADDLSRFAEMLLGQGQRNGLRILNTLAVRKFTTPQSPPDQPVLRGLGWDIDSPFSGNRGELFAIGSFGHTGFTGTSIWMDPVSATYVILLTNSVHPRIRPAITSLRGRVANAVASSLGIKMPGIAITGYNETFFGPGLRRIVARNGTVWTGIDTLVEDRFSPFAGKRIGLVTNHTGLDRDGKRNVDRMAEAGVRVAALFSPEHGMTGREDREDIGNATDAATGIPVFSLYNARNRRPTREMLAGIDALAFDIQDIGARFYTYTTTLGYVLEAAAAQKLPVFVLDRPNPITGTHVEGPMLDPDLTSFIGYMPLPLRHGMTMGELARMFNTRRAIGADLKVIPMRGWQRGDWFDSTNLSWVDPSPNMRSLNAALLYPGVAMLEGSKNYSVGRGTDSPFEQLGADWIRGTELAGYLNAQFIPGTRVYPTRFRPSSGNLTGRDVEGVRLVITDREAFDSSRLGLEIAAAIQRLYPGKLDFARNRWLIGNKAVLNLILSGEDPELIQQAGEEALQGFKRDREEFLLYK